VEKFSKADGEAAVPPKNAEKTQKCKIPPQTRKDLKNQDLLISFPTKSSDSASFDDSVIPLPPSL
jgi:hypothetical protein